jgi:toxin secretion/phage lysis holin
MKSRRGQRIPSWNPVSFAHFKGGMIVKELRAAVESMAKSQEHHQVTGTAGALGSILTFATGGWSEAMTFLIFIMALDYLTGVVASVKEGKGLNSAVGFWGGAKKGLVLLVVILGHRVDVLLGIGDIVMSGVIYFYIANELLSVIENYGRIGLPLPQRLKDIVTVLQDRAKEAPDNEQRR